MNRDEIDQIEALLAKEIELHAITEPEQRSHVERIARNVAQVAYELGLDAARNDALEQIAAAHEARS